MTISGHNTNPNAIVGGYLNSTLNENVASRGLVVHPPSGVSDAQYDNDVFNSAQSYPDNTFHYFALPGLYNFISNLFGGIFGHAYNSDGYVVAVLNHSGVNGTTTVQSLPGWQPGSGDPPNWLSNSVAAATAAVQRALDANGGGIGFVNIQVFTSGADENGNLFGAALDAWDQTIGGIPGGGGLPGEGFHPVTYDKE